MQITAIRLGNPDGAATASGLGHVEQAAGTALNTGLCTTSIATHSLTSRSRHTGFHSGVLSTTKFLSTLTRFALGLLHAPLR
jgi:hypothetical protein